jgi:hypothetical protein
VLDAIGKLYVHGHGIGGYCLACQRLFETSLPALIKERAAADGPVVSMRARWSASAITRGNEMVYGKIIGNQPL